MLICLSLDLQQSRAWHRDLVQRLSERRDTMVRVRHTPADNRNRFVEPLLRLEGALRRHGGGRLARRVPVATLGPPMLDAENPDLTIALSSSGQDGARIWTVDVEGALGEDALWQAVALDRCPVVALRQGARVIASGRFGTESRGQLIESLDDALARLITLILAALDGGAVCPPSSFPDPPPPRLTVVWAAQTAAAIVARRLSSRLYRLAFRTPHWRVGWRRLAGPDLIDLRRHPGGGWRDLRDDGQRFYADPFPLARDGKVTLFVEEYPHATGRGVISAVAFGSNGPEGSPEPVLERPYHLSYPFVFERDGDVWMIPEGAGAGAIELFRATRFPAGWTREATLVAGVEAGDATLWEADGLWWMFATVRDGGASSDALHLWSAPDFRGPWQPHPRNPVLIDIAGARPAGRMMRRGGALIRPVQDCRDGYGAALGVATVTRLDTAGYAQRIETVLSPGPLWPGHCLHTVNEAGGFEFIDGSGRASRLGRARREPAAAGRSV